MAMSCARIIPFDPLHKNAFRELNLEWIRRHFKVEAKDLEQVDHPERCIDRKSVV